MAKNPSCMSRSQAGVQAFLRPAQWVPGMKSLRNAVQTWVMPDSSPKDAYDAVLETLTRFQAGQGGIEGLMGDKVVIAKADAAKHFIRAHLFTAKAEWLDVLEIQVRPAQQKGAEIRARSFSSGLFPTSVPLAPLFSCALFIFPFLGHHPVHGWMNTKRLELIREDIAKSKAIQLVM